MSESMLQREFNQKDVQRMRNIITKKYDASTTTQIGYTKISDEHNEGEVWEENGKHWTIKDGIKQTITKLDGVRKQTTLPLLCPNCKTIMNHSLDNKMYYIHNKCFNCVIEYETELKRQGKFEEYQLNINKQTLQCHLKEMEALLLEIVMDSGHEQFVTEAGDIETWNTDGSLKQQAITELQEYIQKIKDTLSS